VGARKAERIARLPCRVLVRVVREQLARVAVHLRRVLARVELGLTGQVRSVRVDAEVAIERNVLLEEYDDVLDRRGRATVVVAVGPATRGGGRWPEGFD